MPPPPPSRFAADFKRGVAFDSYISYRAFLLATHFHGFVSADAGMLLGYDGRDYA